MKKKTIKRQIIHEAVERCKILENRSTDRLLLQNRDFGTTRYIS